jgi:hypothetical protein
MPIGDNDLGSEMSGKWFANRGQVIQIALTAIALVVAVIVSLPVLKEHKELLDWLPFIFLALAFYGMFQLGRLFTKPTAPSTVASPPVATSMVPTPPASQHPFKTFIDLRSPTIRMGDFWEEKLQYRIVRITVTNIIGGEKPVAELRFEQGYFCSLPGLRTNDFRVFRLPASSPRRDTEENSVFSFGFTEGQIDMFAVRVDHINPHTNEVRLSICNFRAVDIDKPLVF